METILSDRFYRQQLQTLGNCPGNRNPKKRNRKLAWTDEKKQEVIEAYEAANPTPETSMEIVTDLAEEFEESPNGVRMILTKAGVYVKKAPASGAKGNGEAKSGGTRISKAAAQEQLVAALEGAGATVDEDIVQRLTGKAANYFTSVINLISN